MIRRFGACRLGVHANAEGKAYFLCRCELLFSTPLQGGFRALALRTPV